MFISKNRAELAYHDELEMDGNNYYGFGRIFIFLNAQSVHIIIVSMI